MDACYRRVGPGGHDDNASFIVDSGRSAPQSIGTSVPSRIAYASRAARGARLCLRSTVCAALCGSNGKPLAGTQAARRTVLLRHPRRAGRPFFGGSIPCCRRGGTSGHLHSGARVRWRDDRHPGRWASEQVARSCVYRDAGRDLDGRRVVGCRHNLHQPGFGISLTDNRPSSHSRAAHQPPSPASASPWTTSLGCSSRRSAARSPHTGYTRRRTSASLADRAATTLRGSSPPALTRSSASTTAGRDSQRPTCSMTTKQRGYVAGRPAL